MHKFIFVLLALAASLGRAQPLDLSSNFISITQYETQEVSRYQFDRHGKTKVDRQGNPKMKRAMESVAVNKTIRAQAAILGHVEVTSDLLRTESSTQYYPVSAACLNTWWCHVLAGDPSSQTTTQPVYSTQTWFVLVDTGRMVYVCRENGSQLSSFTVNKAVKFGLNGDQLVLVDDAGVNHMLEIVQKTLPPPPQ
jgi:hypothetical protein